MAPKRRIAAVEEPAEEPPAAKAKAKAKPAGKAKAKAAAAAASEEAVVAKTELAQAPALCINGVSGKALQHKIQYRMKSAAPWVKTLYEQKVKFLRGMSNDEKERFVSALLTNEDWGPAYFEKLRRDEIIESESAESEWLSWTRLKSMEDEAVAKSMIEQKSILVRPHRDLNHEDEKVQALDWYVRNQYCYVRDCSATTLKGTDQIERSDNRALGEVSDDGEEKQDEPEPPTVMVVAPETKTANVRARMLKVRADFAKIEPDLDGRLKALESNEYVQKMQHETYKIFSKLKKKSAVLSQAIATCSPDPGYIAGDTDVQQWSQDADDFQEQLKLVKSRIASMKTFIAKSSSSSSSK